MSSRNTGFVLNSHVQSAIAFSGLLVDSNDIMWTSTQTRKEENASDVSKDYIHLDTRFKHYIPYACKGRKGIRFTLAPACYSYRFIVPYSIYGVLPHLSTPYSSSFPHFLLLFARVLRHRKKRLGVDFFKASSAKLPNLPKQERLFGYRLFFLPTWLRFSLRHVIF